MNTSVQRAALPLQLRTPFKRPEIAMHDAGIVRGLDPHRRVAGQG